MGGNCPSWEGELSEGELSGGIFRGGIVRGGNVRSSFDASEAFNTVDNGSPLKCPPPIMAHTLSLLAALNSHAVGLDCTEILTDLSLTEVLPQGF